MPQVRSKEEKYEFSLNFMFGLLNLMWKQFIEKCSMYAPSNIYTHSYLFAIFKCYDFKQGNDFKWLTFHKIGKAINENVLLVPFSQVPGFFFFFFPVRSTDIILPEIFFAYTRTLKNVHNFFPF